MDEDPKRGVRTAGPRMKPLLLLFLLVGGVAAGQAPGAVTYALSPRSQFEVAVSRAGVFSFVGHDHLVRADAIRGHITYDPAAPARSEVEIVVPVDSLEVTTPPDTAEIRKVTAAMRADVLDVAHYHEIRFVSRSVEPIPGGVRVRGALTLVGVTQEVSVDVRVVTAADSLRASGEFSIKQTSFGIHPYHGGPGGLVHVADRVTFRFEAIALRAP
jgi:polyisoprenoid-binding protein YceI